MCLCFCSVQSIASVGLGGSLAAMVAVRGLAVLCIAVRALLPPGKHSNALCWSQGVWTCGTPLDANWGQFSDALQCSLAGIDGKLHRIATAAPGIKGSASTCHMRNASCTATMQRTREIHEMVPTRQAAQAPEEHLTKRWKGRTATASVQPPMP
jgi:hypothetical protein